MLFVTHYSILFLQSTKVANEYKPKDFLTMKRYYSTENSPKSTESVREVINRDGRGKMECVFRWSIPNDDHPTSNK